MKIYHLNDMNVEMYIQARYADSEGVKRSWDNGDYTLVAEVDTDDLEEAFERTNSIDRFWGENEKVTLMDPTKGCRSSSVGDIFKNDEGFFVVKMVGFEKIDLPEHEPLRRSSQKP